MPKHIFLDHISTSSSSLTSLHNDYNNNNNGNKGNITSTTTATKVEKNKKLKHWKNVLIQPIAIPNFQHVVSNNRHLDSNNNSIIIHNNNDNILCKPDGSFSWSSLRNEIFDELSKNNNELLFLNHDLKTTKRKEFEL